MSSSAVNKIKRVMANVRRRRETTKIAYENSRGKYALSEPTITSRTLSITYPFSRFAVPDKLPRGFISMDGRRTLSSLPVVRITKTHGIVGDLSGVNHWYIKTTNGSAIVHRTGTTQITAKSVGRVAQQLERVYPGISNANVMRVTKFDARMSIGRYLILEQIATTFPSLTSYEPELFNRAEVTWPSPSMKLLFYGNGQVQIFGAARPASAVDVVRQIVDRVTPERLFKVLHTTNIAGRPVTEVGFAGHKGESRNEKLARLRRNKLNHRHPLVSGYNHVPNAGKYVRPGPNGKPRLYNIKANMSLVTAKITKAYANAGVNMPQYVANMVLANPPFMMGAPGAKRAKNWNATLNGHYIRPGPGKQPHFYKIPKDLKAGFKTAKKAYNEAGMNVPQRVKNIFGVTGSPASGSPVRANHVVNGNKVNGRQYSRLTTAQLVAIARNLGNAGASNSMSKANIFERIKSKARVKTPSPNRSPNVTVNGRVYIFSNDPLNQRIMRNGRKRVFSTLPKAEREAIARAYLGNNAAAGVQAKNWYNTMRAKKKYGG
jgi:TATA-box binding protein (TBP) (component of TFIID and TFIIIB)